MTDPGAYNAEPRAEVMVDDLFVARYPVTMGEYVAFLNDAIAQKGVPAAQKHVPRQAPTTEQHWTIPDDARETFLPRGWDAKRPVFGVSWDDARVYCEWQTESARDRGQNVSYRLPTSAEWEKAARGVDARFFPWGNHFDWSFARGLYSTPEQRLPEGVGAFAKDESPYGVRDMAGSLNTWCEDWYDEKDNMKSIRGGSWNSPDVAYFRVAGRSGSTGMNVHWATGFRLVRVPRP